MRKWRKDSSIFTIYNEGLVVFLYDKAHAEEIKLRGPSILEGFGDADASDPVLAELARQGMLVVFELYQDDELKIEINVGPPLGDNELKRGSWLEQQQAPIDLPSGQMRIESYNGLQLSPDFDLGYLDDEDDQALPPANATMMIVEGRYRLTLHRVAVDLAGNEPGFLAKRRQRPELLITLGAEQESAPVELIAPMLRLDAA